MTEVTILTERELRGMVGLDREAVDAIEDAFVRLADGKVEMPPIMHNTPPSTHTPMIKSNRPASAAMRPGLKKIPEPITLPTTIAIEVLGPSARFSVTGAVASPVDGGAWVRIPRDD